MEKSNKAILLATLLAQLTYSLLETWKKSGECLMSISDISSFVSLILIQSTTTGISNNINTGIDSPLPVMQECSQIS